MCMELCFVSCSSFFCFEQRRDFSVVFHCDVVQTLNPIVDVGIDTVELVESGVNAFCTLLTEKAEPHPPFL